MTHKVFQCIHCHMRFGVPEAAVGGEGQCPGCGSVVPLPPEAAMEMIPSDDGIATLIPFKNTAALLSYYLGVFSLACMLFLGPPAIILGIIGLVNRAKNPSIHGTAHAWIGIVLGSITTLLGIAAVVLVIIALMQG